MCINTFKIYHVLTGIETKRRNLCTFASDAILRCTVITQIIQICCFFLNINHVDVFPDVWGTIFVGMKFLSRLVTIQESWIVTRLESRWYILCIWYCGMGYMVFWDDFLVFWDYFLVFRDDLLGISGLFFGILRWGIYHYIVVIYHA